MSDMSAQVRRALDVAVEAIGGSAREGQIEMAEAVANALTDRHHLMVQAGTGTGKSLAYLIPGIVHGRKVLVATATLALQRQLVDRDLPAVVPALEKELGREISYAIYKGVGNYVCLQKMNSEDIDPDTELVMEVSSLEKDAKRLIAWAKTPGVTGDRDDAPEVDRRVWAANSTSGRECVGADVCAFGSQCFAANAKAKAQTADIVVTNHTLLAIEIVDSHPILPERDCVILDEAQAIKNPSSQNAKAACSLVARHRLALTGTPIENRLLDLWSIFAFAMPGVLGKRASFVRNFDGKVDLFARRRLSARTRPFLLRRTKNEVARDLPDRVEEDILVEFEGTQAALYKAELKRARAQLLKVETSKQLDKLRFNILTSLLRLRQICCHPRLLGLETSSKKAKKDSLSEDSTKVTALMELLEPLMEEGQKVLVFSQFLEMLEIIRDEITQREWPFFMLTGQTEDRGTLVDSFQNHEGAGIFLISLKAGGAGLNLTAASYVVLFDPWWNPAVEAQAIDRTHRIGQKQTVFAYRLLIKDTIEEKIRRLQKHKGNIANDILGEENFAQALTLDDFQFLLGDETDE